MTDTPRETVWDALTRGRRNDALLDGRDFDPAIWDAAYAALESLEEQLEALREASEKLRHYFDSAEMRWMSVEDSFIDVPARVVAEIGRALGSNPASVSEPETTVLNAGRPTTGSDSSPASEPEAS